MGLSILQNMKEKLFRIRGEVDARLDKRTSTSDYWSGFLAAVCNQQPSAETAPSIYARYVPISALIETGRLSVEQVVQRAPCLLTELVDFASLGRSWTESHANRLEMDDPADMRDAESAKPAVHLLRELLTRLHKLAAQDPSRPQDWFAPFLRALASSICSLALSESSSSTSAQSTASPGGLCASALTVIFHDLDESKTDVARLSSSTAFASTATDRLRQLLLVVWQLTMFRLRII